MNDAHEKPVSVATDNSQANKTDGDGLDAVLEILDIHGTSRSKYRTPVSPNSSRRGSTLERNSPPTSPRGSVRGKSPSRNGSAANSLHKRSNSRPPIPQFADRLKERQEAMKKDGENFTKQMKIEEIKRRVAERQAAAKLTQKNTNHAPHLVDSSSPLLAQPSAQPQSVELLLYGIHENSAGKDIRIITDDSMPVVISMLDQLTPTGQTERCIITRLDLQKNEIGGKGAKQLCECLLKRPSVEILDVSNNKKLFLELPKTEQNPRMSSGMIGAEGYVGADAFKKLLTEHPNLALLMINDCGLNDFGASLIATGIRENQSLVFLDIGNNKFSDTGANHICEALMQHKFIRHVLLDGNNLTVESAKQLLELVQTNTRILTLEINDNSKISEQLVTDIKAQIAQNQEAYKKLEAAQNSGEKQESKETHENSEGINLN
ncbi:MAG: hypothetical protein K2X50_07515 [Gammaproteobacteria bacterium]|nr:hypothetical protein [Gammaproteobacteria bacterium]